MSNFTDVLQEKIDELEEQKSIIDDKIELLQELMEGETDKRSGSPKKRAGRPKGAKNKKEKGTPQSSIHAPADELYEESLKQLHERGEGTSPELQKKLTGKFIPVARPAPESRPGIVAGTKRQVEQAAAARNSGTSISIDEGE